VAALDAARSAASLDLLSALYTSREELTLGNGSLTCSRGSMGSREDRGTSSIKLSKSFDRCLIIFILTIWRVNKNLEGL
jgi:hypothetical protein